MSQEEDCHKGLLYKECFNPVVTLTLMSEQATRRASKPILGQGFNFPLKLKKDACLTDNQLLYWPFPFSNSNQE